MVFHHLALAKDRRGRLTNHGFTYIKKNSFSVPESEECKQKLRPWKIYLSKVWQGQNPGFGCFYDSWDVEIFCSFLISQFVKPLDGLMASRNGIRIRFFFFLKQRLSIKIIGGTKNLKKDRILGGAAQEDILNMESRFSFNQRIHFNIRRKKINKRNQLSLFWFRWTNKKFRPWKTRKHCGGYIEE